jgi:cytochrome oxidase Cu insertion factor (SCO1/SenC/PrrC family)
MASRPTTSSTVRQERLPRILLWSVLGAVLVGVCGLGIRSVVWDVPLQLWPSHPSPADLPVYGSIPDFALINQLGRPVRRVDLSGKVWIASFIFTTCPDECPLMTAEMSRLQSDLANVSDLLFVSISVSPEHDTPAVLSEYASQFQADPNRWFFLTGDKRAIYHLAREGFRLGIVDPRESTRPSPVNGSTFDRSGSRLNRSAPDGAEQPATWVQELRGWPQLLAPASAFADHGQARDTLHSTRFVLVDRLVQIRGYYDSREEADLQRLRRHLQLLLQDG